jgi:hemerythrin-like domain-containing protein
MARATQDPTAIELLTQQHRDVEKLFQQFEDADDAQEKEELFAEIADQLAIHTKIEEQFFYPAVTARKTEDMVLEAFVEHTSVKRLLADLLESDVDDPGFEAQMKVLKEQVQHHVEEEERELFPAANKVLKREEMLALAQEMLALETELQSTDPRNTIPDELAGQPASP